MRPTVTATGSRAAVLPGLGARPGLLYGALGLPLAFAALPLYVLLPQHYAREYGMPLATLGILLLAVRAADAIWDPLIGRWVDQVLARGRGPALTTAGLAAAALLGGFAAVFHAPSHLDGDSSGLLAWCAAALAVTFLAYSVAGVLHQAWAARLGGSDTAQARRVAAREGAALAGVLLASVLPSLAGWGTTIGVLAAALAAGWAGLAMLQADTGTAGPRPADTDPPRRLSTPWQSAPFRRLMAVYLLNGMANAVPATLLLFFVQDVLQASSWTAALLAGYFAAGAISLPLWVRAVSRWGLERVWGAGMLLAVATFSSAAWLGPGDVVWFSLVCAASGLALGADLAAPAALLARVIAASGHTQAAEGVYFGWWNGASKLNLALAAGVALPLLQLAGYTPGTADASGLAMLGLVYALLPCALKLLALAALSTLAGSAAHPTRFEPR